MIDKTIETKEIYQEKMIYLQKKNQTVHLFSYQEFKNINIIYLLTSFIFISIQTILPPINSKQIISHYKNKIKCSFSGYPIKSSKKDYSGINYISMIVLNLKSTVIP